MRVTAGIAVAGPISAADLALEQLTILGTTVVVDAETRIVEGDDTRPMGGLEVGAQVEVAGFADSSGVLFARRISPRRASTPLRVKGDAEDVDSTRHRFRVNGQTVDYTDAALVGFAGRELAHAPVRVDADNVDSQGVLLATEVLFREPGLPGKAGDTAVVQGWVTRFASERDFDVDGHPVVTTADTVVEGPLTELIGAIRLDNFVLVEGRLTSNGTVEASKISTTEMILLDTVITVPPDAKTVGSIGMDQLGSCTVTPETVFQIDGLRANASGLHTGDVATIHAHSPGHVFYVTPFCRRVVVEHNVTGPLESKPTTSAAFSVMGQRVWVGYGGIDSRGDPASMAELATLNVGDIVEVSGHTTGERDIVASGIHRASHPGTRVIGFARAVDAVAERFELGALTVDYSQAAVGGFDGDAPRNNDRVVVISDSPATNGVLSADVVRYAADMPRGSAGSLMTVGGLVTRFASRDSFDVEGRTMVPLDAVNPHPTNLPDFDKFCDWTTVGPNLRFWQLVVVGGTADPWLGTPIYLGGVCPPGREPTSWTGPSSGFPPPIKFAPPPLEISGPIQSIDFENQSIRIAGMNLMLHPATLLSSRETAANGTYTEGPTRLDSLGVGDRVKVYGPKRMPVEPITIDQIWLGLSELLSDEIVISGNVESVSEPEIALDSGIHVTVRPETVFEHLGECADNAYVVDHREFWSNAEALKGRRFYVGGAVSGDELLVVRVFWADEAAYDCRA